MSKIEFEVVKGEWFSRLQRHSRIDMPIKRFLNDNIEIDTIGTGEEIAGYPVQKEIARNSYKVTVTIEVIE